LDDSLEILERELGVHRNFPGLENGDGIHGFSAAEGVLHAVMILRHDLREKVTEEQFAQVAA
jgi:hypothetical protein